MSRTIGFNRQKEMLSREFFLFEPFKREKTFSSFGTKFPYPEDWIQFEVQLKLMIICRHT